MAFRPFQHLGLKLLSLVVAIFLWYAVSGEQVVERSLRAPLELQNIPESLEVVGDVPSQVDVRVRGPSGTLTRLGVGDLAAVLDLRGARAGSRLFHLTTDQVRVPFGIEVTQVTPSTIAMGFERAGARTVPVTPSVEGEPAPGYSIGEISSDPPEVEVVGPETVLRGLTRAITEPVVVTGARSTIRESVTIGVPDSSLRLRTARTARVTVTVVPVPIERTIENVPLRIDRVGSRAAQSTPSIVNVTVKGDRTRVAGLDVNAIGAVVDASNLGPGRYDLAVRITPIQDVEIVVVQPPTVSVRVK
jgi:YbbR domain-containing protein